MMRWLRRLFWFSALAAAGCGAYRVLVKRRATTPTMPTSAAVAAPAWSPSPYQAAEAAETARAARWVASENGECPTGYPIKVKEGSGIYHVPGGRFYSRTAADRCYASTDDAIADGYRPAKA